MPRKKAEEAPAPEPVAIPTLLVKPSGLLEGRTLRMRYPSTRWMLAVRRGETNDEGLWSETLNAIEDHDIGRDPADLPPLMIVEISNAWVEALKELALPQAEGES